MRPPGRDLPLRPADRVGGTEGRGCSDAWPLGHYCCPLPGRRDRPGNASQTSAPPLDEMPPTFWEEYGLAAVVGGVLALPASGRGRWWPPGPNRFAAPRARSLARRALDPFRGQPEDGALLSRVSQVLRRYFSAAFGLPPGQMTTTEFCGALAAHPNVGAELRQPPPTSSAGATSASSLRRPRPGARRRGRRP